MNLNLYEFKLYEFEFIYQDYLKRTLFYNSISLGRTVEKRDKCIPLFLYLFISSSLSMHGIRFTVS